MTHEKYMRSSVNKALLGIKKRQTPFAACIVKNNQVVSCSHNRVWRKTDITAHAEIEAIRSACRKLKTIDLSGCIIYSTCEPCPMCFSACHWARISKIVYGASIADAKRAGFNELAIPVKKMKHYSKNKLSIISGVLSDECKALFSIWKQQHRKKSY